MVGSQIVFPVDRRSRGELNTKLGVDILVTARIAETPTTLAHGVDDERPRDGNHRERFQRDTNAHRWTGRGVSGNRTRARGEHTRNLGLSIVKQLCLCYWGNVTVFLKSPRLLIDVGLPLGKNDKRPF